MQASWGHRHIPFLHLPSKENASLLIRKCYMKSCREYWSIFSRRNKYKSSASEGFFGVFIPLLGKTKAENFDEKLLGNSLITAEFLNFFFIYPVHTILLIIQMWQIIHKTRAPNGTVFVTSRYDMGIPVFFSSSLMIPIKQ